MTSPITAITCGIYQKQKYSCKFGVGLCDEWPLIAYPDHYTPGLSMLCLTGHGAVFEALVSREAVIFNQARRSGAGDGRRV